MRALTSFVIILIFVRCSENTPLDDPEIPFVCVEGAETIDRPVLEAIFHANPDNSLTWDLERPVSEWDGVEITDCRVTDLYLNSANLVVLPPEIGKLEELKQLQKANPDEPRIAYNLGRVSSLVAQTIDDPEAQAAKLKEAKTAYERVAQEFPDSPIAQAALNAIRSFGGAA